MLSARFIPSISHVAREDWDRLVGPDDSPFNEWTFLRACEEGSTVPVEGTAPQHLTLWEEERLIAALPMFLKGDGRGEFIYDWHWYQFAARSGIPYYPKLLAMSPFTPVPGPRLLVDPALGRAALLPAVAQIVEDFAREHELRGVHYLFTSAEEADLLEGRGYLRRLTYQPCWSNAAYESFDAFLARFRSKDRVKIRREIRRMQEQGVTIEARSGDDIEAADWEAMHGFFQRTCLLFGTGSDYLKPGTWAHLFDHWRERIVLFLAFREGERIGGSLCVHKDGSLYGRYWGSVAQLNALYFNLAYYAPIRLAIERGWRRFFAGFGNTKTKYDRGLDPQPTHSVHCLFDERLRAVVASHLQDDTEQVQWRIDRQQDRTKLRHPRP